jgi:hypothetical protein
MEWLSYHHASILPGTQYHLHHNQFPPSCLGGSVNMYSVSAWMDGWINDIYWICFWLQFTITVPDIWFPLLENCGKLDTVEMLELEWGHLVPCQLKLILQGKSFRNLISCFLAQNDFADWWVEYHNRDLTNGLCVSPSSFS